MSGKAVLISGIGIAGPTLAFWLKAAGFTPTLVERAPALRTGGYVIDFWGLGYDIAQRMGLEPDLNRLGYHMREARIVDDRGARVTSFGTKVFDELTGGRFVTIERTDLSRLLFDRARQDAEVIFDDEIVDLDDRPGGVVATLKKGGARRFDLIVGADGLHSRVRELVFGREDQFEKYLGYVVAAFEVSGYSPRDPDVYLMHSHPGSMIARFTLNDDRVLFLFIFAADTAEAPAATDGQKALLRQRYHDGGWECRRILEELDRTPSLYFDRVSQIRMDRWARGRVALVGDAAFCVSLAAGQGSALAMISAYVLAGELAKCGDRYETAFSTYDALLRSYIETKQRGAKRLASALAPRTAFGLWFRNLVLKSFSVPGLARIMVGRDITDRLRLADYQWPGLDS